MSTVEQMSMGIYQWLTKSMGKEEIFTITFDIDFVVDNLIDASFDGQAIDQVAFTDDQATTMALLAKAIQETGSILECLVTGPNELTCQGKFKGVPIVVVGPDTVGGVTQPVATIAIVQEALKLFVIRNHQTAPRPYTKLDPDGKKEPYAYFMIGTELTYPLEDDFLGFNENYLAKRAGIRAVTVSVQTLGENALQYLRDARRALNLQEVKDELLYTYGLAFMDTLGIQNLTGFLETEREERGAMDLRFSHGEEYLEDTNWIETVEIEGDIEGGINEIHIENVYPLIEGV